MPCLFLKGIIHTSTHNNTESFDATEGEMMRAIFAALELLVEIARPKKLLFVSVDGVAPRAKMNQQRQRRFKSAYPSSQGAQSEDEVQGERVNSAWVISFASRVMLQLIVIVKNPF